MSCWDILGIDSSADKKKIKIAYSKLLKTCRPDDDPEGFQRLHSAYKLALSEANSSHTPQTRANDSDHLKSSQVVDYDARTELESTALPEPTAERLALKTNVPLNNAKQNELGDELENEWHHFVSLVDDAMRDQQTANEMNSWENVVKSPLITDLLLKDSASDYVFDAISMKNMLYLNNDKMYVESGTLNHLNAFFSWRANWEHLDKIFDHARLDAVLPFLDEEEKHETPQEAQPHIFSKIVSYLTGLLSITAGYSHINLFIAITLLAIPSTINRVYTRKWQTNNYGRVIGGEDDSIQKNVYLLYTTLFFAMWLSMLVGYIIGWTIHYLIN